MSGLILIPILFFLFFLFKEYKIRDWSSFEQARKYVVSRKRGTYKIFKFNGGWRVLRASFGPKWVR